MVLHSSAFFPMVAITSPLQSGVQNRRRRVRHKIQTPAYATFATEQSNMLDLHEIVDISEDGVAIQCHSPLHVDQEIDLCLDLVDCPQQILTTAHVIWTNDSGRAGLRFSALASDSLLRLREWLFLNVMSGVANSEVELLASAQPPRPSYTDTLAAVTVVQRQVENLGADFDGALQLIAQRSEVFLRASGSAIALAESDSEFMICRASSGPDAPPVGARLQVGSGFSGECVKSGMPLRCDDTELDDRVDRESCHALGIRSILAAPVRASERSIGLIEVFSTSPNTFTDVDQRVLLKLAETVLQAATRSGRVNVHAIVDRDAKAFVTPQASVLFASADEQSTADPGNPAPSLSLPRSYLLLLTFAAGAISMALGFLTAPFVQSTAAPWIIHKIRSRQASQLPTVLASSNAQVVRPVSTPIETATLDQLKEMAGKGNADAANAIGLRYATGEGVTLNEREAARWFLQAAEQGSIAAQSKLGAFYYSGRGVSQDTNRAYFWMVVASLNGDEASKALAPHASARLTRGQVAAIEQNAARWLQLHSPKLKSIAAD